MDSNKVRQIIGQYKLNFKDIHKEEIYKWRAVKCFQDNWDIQATDFSKMLNASFALAYNLLDSGRYFPKQMLQHYVSKEPETIRFLFKNLYNEDNDLTERITSFQRDIKSVNVKYFSGENDFQDHRAILVYLCLRYPDRYFLYKFRMFKAFVQLVDYPYQPTKGNIENILQYLTLCNILNEEIIKDNELLELHKTRITEMEFFDSSFNILTQDIIYAAVSYTDKFEQSGKQEAASIRLVKIDKTVSPSIDKVVLKGSFTNYIDNEKENKRIGDLGELLVLQFEQEKLKSFGIKKVPELKSKSQGDGLGYDILSYDEHGQEIFIEVKTTVSDFDTPFYITRNELERSILEPKRFILYRLFFYNDINNSAKFYERKGELTDLCTNPILYRVKVSE